jgi:hypothetical protein
MTGKTIFLGSGKTFTFYDVKDVVENETSLTFTYKAVSDNRVKTVTFYRPEMVGHSTFDYQEKL